MHRSPYTRPPFKVIAHRGNSCQAPENTIASFRQAVNIGVEFLECDVQLSKDGVPMVIHDSTFHRITSEKNAVEVDQLPLKKIKEFDAGLWFRKRYKGEKIPTLEEFFNLPKKNIGIMLDIKEETVKDCFLAKKVGDLIKETSHHTPIIVGSLSPNILLCLEAYLPEQKFIPIIEKEEQFREFEVIQAKHYALHYSLAKRKKIEELHEKGIEVWVWTVDDKPTAMRLVDRGVDGIITNRPKKMMGMHLAPRVEDHEADAELVKN